MADVDKPADGTYLLRGVQIRRYRAGYTSMWFAARLGRTKRWKLGRKTRWRDSSVDAKASLRQAVVEIAAGALRGRVVLAAVRLG